MPNSSNLNVQADGAREGRQSLDKVVEVVIKNNEEMEDLACQSKEAIAPKASKHRHSNSSMELLTMQGLLKDGSNDPQLAVAADLGLKTALQSAGGWKSPGVYGNEHIPRG